MIDSYGNGWSSGSYVTIKQNGKAQTFALNSGLSELIYFTADGMAVSNNWIIVAIVVIVVIIIIIIICCSRKASNNTNKKQLPKTKENKPTQVEKPVKPAEVKVKI